MIISTMINNMNKTREKYLKIHKIKIKNLFKL